jgi:hypothetical protein
MRIPVRVESFAGGLRPLLSICIKSESPKIFGFINAVIDTGSPCTILGAGDVQRMRISQLQMQKLIGAEKEVSLGGAQLKTRILPDAELKVSEKTIKIPVQVPVKLIKGNPPPTILGIDFLLEGKFKFFFYPTKKEAYLETEE